MWLPVSGGHELYYEVHGQASRPSRHAVILHGGPGGGMQRFILKLFDLSQWCVVLFDQRGCGNSKPFLETRHNTTWDLIEDIERLREQIGVDSWMVMGGSWGTTLALMYAETYPMHVSKLILRGTCLCDEESFRWLYEKGGASEIYPDAWKIFNKHKGGWKSLLRHYQAGLKGKNAQSYADAWWAWEDQLSYLTYQPDHTTSKEAMAIATMELHYFLHDCWLKKGQLIKGLTALRDIPITMIHGQYDMICPLSGAYAIKEALPHAKLVVVKAGHATVEPVIWKALKRVIGSKHAYTRKARRV